MTSSIRTAAEQSLAIHQELVELALTTHQAAQTQWLANGDAARRAFELGTNLQQGLIRAVLKVSSEPAKA